MSALDMTPLGWLGNTNKQTTNLELQKYNIALDKWDIQKILLLLSAIWAQLFKALLA